MDNIEEKRDAILVAASEVALLEGWCNASLGNIRRSNEDFLSRISEKAGYDRGMARLLFPGGKIDLVKALFDKMNRDMLQLWQESCDETLGITRSIESSIILILDIMERNRELMEQTLIFLRKPQNTPDFMKIIWSTADVIWYEVGKDKSTDHNHYSKRILLSGVYLRTLRTWRVDGLQRSKDLLYGRLRKSAYAGAWLASFFVKDSKKDLKKTV